MKRVGHAIFLIIVACGPSKAPREDAAVVVKPSRNPAAECATIFDRAHAKLAPSLMKLGLGESTPAARTRNGAGVGACGQFSDVQRTCLLEAPVDSAMWLTCKVEAPFVLFDGTPARDKLLGAKVSAESSKTRVDALVGTWLRPAVGLDDAVQWTIASGGRLVVKRTAKPVAGAKPPVKPTTEPLRELAFLRDRQLAIKTGTSSQFVPAFVDGDRIYLSWTSGALAIPITSEAEFVLDVADRDRWVIRHGESCELVDPQIGAAPLVCAFEDDAATKTRRFVYAIDNTPHAWSKRGDVLVHPAMEVFAKQR